MIFAVETGLLWRAPGSFGLLALLIVVAVICWQHRARGALLSVEVVEADSAALPQTWRTRAASAPLVLEVLAVAAMVFALARPVVVDVEPPTRLGRDVLLCFDRSSSMAATDLSPTKTRLAAARELASQFLAQRVDDRLGIVSFARYADLVCPPTADRDAVVELLGRVQLVEAEGPEDMTAIGAAVGLAANLLQESSAPSKVVVLLTDGEENVAAFGAPDQIAPLHAGQWCRDLGVRVYTIAVGRGELAGDGRWRSLDTTAIEQLALISGGRFFAAGDARSLAGVYDEIDQLEAAVFSEPGVRVTEWFAAPAIVGMVLLAAARALRAAALGGAA